MYNKPCEGVGEGAAWVELEGVAFLTNCSCSPSHPSQHPCVCACVFLTSVLVLRASLKNLSPSHVPVKTAFAIQRSESHGLVLVFKANMQHSNNEVAGGGVNIQRY